MLVFSLNKEKAMVQKNKKWIDWIWEAWCVISVIGIWPRFIEPNLLSITKIRLPVPNLPNELEGLKILQFTDLHWHSQISRKFLNKLTFKINRLNPDLIVFTGDFLCRGKLENPEGLKDFLCSLKAREGCFAVFGNHDYEKFITVSPNGDYDVDRDSSVSMMRRGFKRLFSKVRLSKKITDCARAVGFHNDLIQLLKTTPFRLLHNETACISLRGSFLNLSGVGEYIAGKLDLENTFKTYDHSYPGVILMHNPDAIPRLENYPGSIILSGHTHGGQVNLPFLWKKLTYMEYPEFKSGLNKCGSKWSYVNRGVGSLMRFRWFAMPELSLITLYGEK